MPTVKELEGVLRKSAELGWGANTQSKTEIDGSHTVEFSIGDFRFHDSFFGGEPYGGREVISYKDKPFWIQVYYGRIINQEQASDQVYTFLKKALTQKNDNFPVRGPRDFREGAWHYVFDYSGNLVNYSGVETIFYEDHKVYEAMIAGGLVDQR